MKSLGQLPVAQIFFRGRLDLMLWSYRDLCLQGAAPTHMLSQVVENDGR